MQKKKIQSDKAPKAIGPYSQAIEAGNLVFCSGQIPLDPATGAMVSQDISAQAHQVMKNLLAVLGQAGLGAEHIVKTTILLQNLEHFTVVNDIYGGYLKEPYPARATYQVSALPKGALIEIEAIAARS